jgi:hypothetical protein
MKAVRLKEGQKVNPLYSSREADEARQAGKPYDTPKFLTCPIGEEVEHKDCWRLCTTGEMAPADDECREKVLRWMGNPGRQKLIEQIRAVQAARGRNQLPKSNLQWLEYMEKAYAKELGLMPAEPEPAASEESAHD